MAYKSSPANMKEFPKSPEEIAENTRRLWKNADAEMQQSAGAHWLIRGSAMRAPNEKHEGREGPGDERGRDQQGSVIHRFQKRAHSSTPGMGNSGQPPGFQTSQILSARRRDHPKHTYQI